MSKDNSEVQGVSETALATTATAAMATVDADPAMTALLASLPEVHRAKVAKMVRPTGEEFNKAALATTGEQQERLLDLIERMSPNKPGVHLSTEGFAPTMVKLYHGVGKDETRPAKLVPGSFYSTTSRDLTEKMTVAVLGYFDGRTLWPPKDAESSSPVCYSNDGLNGSKYGACNTCPSLKLPYNKGGCTPQFNFWFIDKDLTGIFELSFSKTSYSAGKALARILKDSRRPWDRWIEVQSVPRVEGDKQWFVIKATPVQDSKNPANNETSKPLREVFSLLSRSLDLEAYYPRLSRQYNRPADEVNEPAPAAGGAGKPLSADTNDGDFGGANTTL